MFIELTDHLRCPADHEEQYLVLLPAAVDGRDVRAGELGCPVCGRTFRIADGVLDVGGAPATSPPDASALTVEVMTALLGFSGPGGYYVLVGMPGTAWREMLEANAGIAPVLVNPPDAAAAQYPASVLRGGLIPLKRRTMRGVVLGPGYAADPAWVREAARVVLPGLRIVGEGPEPDDPALELLASADGVWVAQRSSRG